MLNERLKSTQNKLFLVSPPQLFQQLASRSPQIDLSLSNWSPCG